MRLWAIGRYDLGLSEDALWRLTLRRYDALHARWKAREHREDYRTATICAAFWEVFRDHDKRLSPYTPEDFMPHYVTPQTPEQMLDAVKVIAATQGGKK